MLHDEYLSPSEVARLVGLSTERIRQLADSGRLASTRSPLGRLISRVGLEDFARGRGIVIASQTRR